MLKTGNDDYDIAGLTNRDLLIMVYVFGGIFMVALIGVVSLIFMLGVKEKKLEKMRNEMGRFLVREFCF